jgi:sugar phosphate isomerase/epimerase
MRHDVCYALRKKPHYSWQDAVEEMVPVIREITEYAAAKGIRTCTENHGFIFQEPERVETLIRTVAHPNYGWLVDMGNFLCAEADPQRAVAIAAPYAFHVHAKDFLFKPGTEPQPAGFFGTRGQNWLRGTVIGHGVVPIQQCVQILKKAGYDGWMSVEFEGMESCLQAIELGGKHLRACAERA